MYRNELDESEWRFLLTGGIQVKNPSPNPYADWLPDKSWLEVIKLNELNQFWNTWLQENVRTNVSAS
jgi:dynein heavy chain